MSIRLAGWIADPDAPHACLLYVAGGDPAQLADRVAFIEKTPRVRVRPFTDDFEDWRNWRGGYKGDEGYQEDAGRWHYDRESQEWCEAELRQMGYVLDEVQP